MSCSSQDIELKWNWAYIKGYNSATYLWKMTCNNPELDLAKIKAYIKFGETLPIGSEDIERNQILA